MIPVSIEAQATDHCVSPEELTLWGLVTSSQPDDSDGSGDHTGDVDGEDGYSAPVPIDLVLGSDGSYIGDQKRFYHRES